jgi:Zn-dependent M28 family amino/carboxypeptidase
LTELVPRLRSHVAALEGVRHHIATPERHRAARDYVAGALRESGCEVRLEPFRFRGVTHHNVVGTIPGTDPKRPALVVGAHYDSTADTPGADDNASGVAVLVECARELARGGRNGATVHCVGFDLEEAQTMTGTYAVGSRELARAWRKAGVVLSGALVLEMVGYRDPAPGSQIVPPLILKRVPSTGDFLAAVGDGKSKGLLEKFCAAGATARPGLTIVPYKARLRGWLLPLTRLSDNASFWDAGYPSLMVTDTAFLRNPHYHRATDTAATLDFGFMADVLAVTVAAAARIAG